MFSERFDKRNKFNFDGTNLPYEKLSSLVESNVFGEGEIIPVMGMFTHSKSKYGKTGVIVYWSVIGVLTLITFLVQWKTRKRF